MDHFAGTARAWNSFFYIEQSVPSKNKEEDTLVFYAKKTICSSLTWKCLSGNSPKKHINSCIMYIQRRIHMSWQGFHVCLKKTTRKGGSERHCSRVRSGINVNELIHDREVPLRQQSTKNQTHSFIMYIQIRIHVSARTQYLAGWVFGRKKFNVYENTNRCNG